MSEENKAQLVSAKITDRQSNTHLSAQAEHPESQRMRPRRSRAPRFKDRRDLPRSRRLAPIERPQHQEGAGTPDDTVKIIPLGGLGEVGRNMCVIEYKEDIMIIDVGFGFPEEDMPGVDYTIPNISYLVGKQSRIRGIVFTHGHMDHVGALPYLLERLGNP